MDRKRAVLINIENAKALCPQWRPMIKPDELDYANARLRQTRMPYQWQWVSEPSSLAGSVTLTAPAHDASTQFSSGGDSC